MRIQVLQKFLLLGFILAVVSLACSLSPKSGSAPVFLAPGGENYPTDTPLAVVSIGGGIAPTADSSIIEAQISETAQAPTNTPAPSDPTPTMTPTLPIVNTTPIIYYTQAGDTLPVVAVRFGVQPDEISSPEEIPERAIFNPGQLLIIPNRLANTTSSQHFMPDSEVVYSPSGIDFDVKTFVEQAGG